MASSATASATRVKPNWLSAWSSDEAAASQECNACKEGRFGAPFAFPSKSEIPERNLWAHPPFAALACALRIPDNLRFIDGVFFRMAADAALNEKRVKWPVT